MYAKNYLNFKSPGARFSISQANSNFAQIIFLSFETILVDTVKET